jgi:hypothetical protein
MNINTLGDLLLACMHDAELFQYLDNFGGTSLVELQALLSAKGISGLTEARLAVLFADLRNIGMRIWLHELRIWCVAHPAPVTYDAMRGTGSNWTPG